MNKKNLIRILVLLGVIGLFVIVRYLGVFNTFSLENFNTHREAITSYVLAHYTISVILFVLLYSIIVTFGIPVSPALAVIGGFLFGAYEGAIYALLASLIGATAAFTGARYLMGHFLQSRYREQLKKYNHEVEQYGPWYIIILNFFPVTPFFITNTAAGLSTMPLWKFILATLIGILPSTLIYTCAGRKLGIISKPSEILSPGIIAALIGLTLISVGAMVFKKWKDRQLQSTK